jgi:hypothetical protein
VIAPKSPSFRASAGISCERSDARRFVSGKALAIVRAN